MYSYQINTPKFGQYPIMSVPDYKCYLVLTFDNIDKKNVLICNSKNSRASYSIKVPCQVLYEAKKQTKRNNSIE